MQNETVSLTRAGVAAVLGLGATQIIHWGSILYAIAVLGPSMRTDLQLSPETTYGGLSLALLSGSLISVHIGGLIDRIGGRKVMAAGSLIAALGLVALGSAREIFGYAFGWVLLGVAMPMALYEAAFASLSQVTGENARRSITYLTFLGGLASTVSWPLTTALLHSLGWRDTLFVYAGLSVAICIPLHLLVLRDVPRVGPITPLDSPENSSVALLTPRHRPKAFLLFAIAILLQNFISSGLAAHLLNLLEGLGLGMAAAVTVGTLLGPAQVSGRIGEMIFGGHRPALWTGLTAWGLLPISFAVLLIFGTSFASAAAFSILYGISNGLTTIARGTIPLALFGRDGYGRLLGKLAAPARFAGALGPIIFATVNARLGAMASVWVCTSIALLALLALLSLWRYTARHGPAVH